MACWTLWSQFFGDLSYNNTLVGGLAAPALLVVIKCSLYIYSALVYRCSMCCCVQMLLSWEAATVQRWARSRQEDIAADHDRRTCQKRGLKVWTAAAARGGMGGGGDRADTGEPYM